MLGWIMPAPFAKPVIRKPAVSDVAIFGTVSVVMMARAKISALSGESAETSCGRASQIRSTGSGRPMTPVEDTKTCEAGQSNWRATSDADRRAAAIPCSPVTAFALPAFTRTARHVLEDCARFSRDTRIGAAGKALRV